MQLEQLLCKRKRSACAADDAEPTGEQLGGVLQALSRTMCQVLGREETRRMLTVAGDSLPR
jgi:hypothetical protein